MKVKNKKCVLCGKNLNKSYHRQIGRYYLCDNGCDKDFHLWQMSEDCLIRWVNKKMTEKIIQLELDQKPEPLNECL